MPINTSQIYLNLDTNKPNVKIDERFLQGNTDKTLNIKFLKNNEPITITDGVKATLTLVFYNGSSVYKKYVIKPTLDGGGNNTNYKIPAITNNMLTIPFTGDVAFVDHAGRTDLIIKIDDSGAYYTYSCTYNVDANEAYNPVGIIDNLPSIDGIKADVANLKTEVNQAKTDITANTQALTTKASKDLSNVGTFAAAPEGSLLYKKDGQLKSTPIIIDDTDKIIDSPYSLKVPANTIDLGDNISLKENGGFINFYTKASGKYYVALDYENDATAGSKKPIYYERGPLQTKVELQNVDTTTMNNVTTINLGTATSDVQVQAIYLKLVNSVNNFKAKLTINSKDVAYYPSKAAWDGTENGLNLVSGLQRIPLSPFWSTITGFNRTFTIKADGPINLLGNGTLPYIAEDLNPITKKDIALMDDIPSVNTETGASIRDKLENLTGNDRLSATAIKNLPNQTVKVTGEQGTPEYDATKILFPFANSIINDSGNVTVNTSFVVTDENDAIVPDCSIIEVPTTSLISANQNQGNSNAAVLDFKGIPVDMGDTTPVVNSKYLRFPQALVINEGDKTTINTAPEVTSDGNVIMGRAETFEFPSDGGLKVEGVTGTDAVKISSKGFKATRNGVTQIDGVKTLAFDDDDLIIGTEDITDSSKLNVGFLGLPISKTNTSTVRKATKIEFPQANVFGTDGGTVHVGTGHSVSKNDPVGGVEEITAACNNWTFTGGLNAEINPNDPNGVVVSATDSSPGISITNDDTESANQTLFAYFPQARISDGSLTGSKLIKTSTPIVHDTDTFEDYKKIALSTHDFTITRKQDDNDTLELDFNGISVDSQGNELAGVKIISLDNEQFDAQEDMVGVADVMLKNAVRSGYLAYVNDEIIIDKDFIDKTRITKIFPKDVLIADSSVVTDANEKTFTLLAGENGISYNYLISAIINTQFYYDNYNDTFKLYLWNENTDSYLLDVDGNPCIGIRAQQKGTKECTIEFTSVVKLDSNTKISLRLEDTLSTRILFIPSIITKISGIMIEKLADDNQLSAARTQFQNDTMRALRVSKHVYGNSIYNAASYLKPGYNLDAQNINSSVYILNLDNWLFQANGVAGQILGTVKVEDGILKALPSADPNYISYGYYIPSETTSILRGTELKFEVQTEYRHGDMIIEAFNWNGDRDAVEFPPFSSIDGSGNYTLKPNWSIITSSTVNVPGQSTPSQETKACTAVVPDDCNNLYFCIRTKGTQEAPELWVSGSNIGIPGDTPLTKWLINTPLNYNEQVLKYDVSTAKFSCNEDNPKEAKRNWADAGVRNQVNIGGKVIGNGPIDLVLTKDSSDVDKYYGDDHWRGYLKANFTGSMDVAYSYGVSNYSIADTTDTLKIYMAKGDDIATAVKIPESESTWTITQKGNQSLTPDRSLMAVFKVDNIQPNDKFWIIAESTNGRKFMITDQNEILFTIHALDPYDIDQQNKIVDLEAQIQALQAILKATDAAKTNKAYVELGWDTGNSKPLLEAKTTV